MQKGTDCARSQNPEDSCNASKLSAKGERDGHPKDKTERGASSISRQFLTSVPLSRSGFRARQSKHSSAISLAGNSCERSALEAVVGYTCTRCQHLQRLLGYPHTLECSGCSDTLVREVNTHSGYTTSSNLLAPSHAADGQELLRRPNGPLDAIVTPKFKETKYFKQTRCTEMKKTRDVE